MKRLILLCTLAVLLCGVIAVQAQEPVTLTLAAYTTPREAYAEIIPLFQAYWLAETGQQVEFQESYLGSGAQSRAVAGGFEADVVALSLERDVTRLVDAGLITADWQDNPYNGMVSTSLVVLVVRPGNPKHVTDWADLTRDDIEILTPDPATSGGAQWNVIAAYGAAERGYVDGYDASAEGAYAFLVDWLPHVSVFDSAARDSVITYSQGIGDVLITYENEYFAGIAAGDEYDIVYPSSSVLIENPVAVVDTYADAHGVRDVAAAFVAFLYTDEAQAIFADKGYRPPVVQAEAAEAVEATPEAADDEAAAPAIWPAGMLDETQFPLIEDIFTVEYFGGWSQIGADFFSDTGIYTQAITEAQQ
ncbi:MAG: sulfate ABC transporter substrate-binding protein [Anaerolineae bacterium]|nr:sulfate ABC transporter substrate-binding protein [Anaerolineae bacterium]